MIDSSEIPTNCPLCNYLLNGVHYSLYCFKEKQVIDSHYMVSSSYEKYYINNYSISVYMVDNKIMFYISNTEKILCTETYFSYKDVPKLYKLEDIENFLILV